MCSIGAIPTKQKEPIGVRTAPHIGKRRVTRGTDQSLSESSSSKPPCARGLALKRTRSRRTSSQ